MEPQDEERIRRNIERIEAYTREKPELIQSHHFLYDLRMPRCGNAEFMVMGINPGESPRYCANFPGPTEETSRFDWIEAAGFSRACIPWSDRACFYLDGAHYVMTELFLWSSRNVNRLKERLGEPLRKSRHLPFCHEMNLALIDAHRPRAIIVVGLGAEPLCRDLYGLQRVRRVCHDNVRVAEQYRDDAGRPWLITKHWTNGWGLTTGQCELIRDTIRGFRR
jgi:hypothetical protein